MTAAARAPRAANRNALSPEPEAGTITQSATRNAQSVTLGLSANWRQFSLLVLINAFVGGMVGLERVVVPLLGRDTFHLSSAGAATGFIAGFGLTKAVVNLLAGRLAERHGRRRVLIAGWLAGVPVPLLIIWAPTWGWVILANVFLGVNQGLAWSMTVNMKIDLVGSRRRGLALGLNECAGYLAVATAAFASGLIAERYGLRPAPFYLGIAIVALGLALSVLLVRDTSAHVAHEERVRESGETGPHPAPRPAGGPPPPVHGGGVYPSSDHHWLSSSLARSAGEGGPGEPGPGEGLSPVPDSLSLPRALLLVSLRDRTLSTCAQAGLVNNLNDGLAWGILPLYFAASGLDLQRIGLIAAAYPWTWGLLQLVTGALSDRWGRKWLIAGGMWLQAVAILGIGVLDGFGPWLVGALLMGAGTAMVYPTLLAAVGDVTRPAWRSTALGVYRFWRDAGFAAGALGAGLLADAAGFSASIITVAALTGLSGCVVAVRMAETAPRPGVPRGPVGAGMHAVAREVRP